MMTPNQHLADECQCPACDGATPGEWDEALRVFHCPTCSTTWRRRARGRLVPRVSQPRLFAAPMELTTELD